MQLIQLEQLNILRRLTSFTSLEKDSEKKLAEINIAKRWYTKAFWKSSSA